MPPMIKPYVPPLLLLLVTPALAQPLPPLGEAELRWLGGQIYNNECSRRPACLTAWNEGEDFPSLGIGHFIWYRAGQKEPYTESFPALLAFMGEHGARIPAWLAGPAPDVPWQDRDAFLAARESPRLRQLRAFLEDNIPLQTAFIVQRFEAALEPVLAASPPAARAAVRGRFFAVAQAASPQGLYALIDYINFKGEGVSPRERYQGQGWGLLQVLEAMADEPPGGPLERFVSAAEAVLARRVENAPPERDEARWLAGWHRRLATYLLAAPDARPPQ